MGLVTEKYEFPTVLPYQQHGYSPTIIAGAFSNCSDDDRKCPCGEQWSELQRDDRIAAESASHPLPRNKFSLWWQLVAAKAALQRSCSDH